MRGSSGWLRMQASWRKPKAASARAKARTLTRATYSEEPERSNTSRKDLSPFPLKGFFQKTWTGGRICLRWSRQSLQSLCPLRRWDCLCWLKRNWSGLLGAYRCSHLETHTDLLYHVLSALASASYSLSCWTVDLRGLPLYTTSID